MASEGMTQGVRVSGPWHQWVWSPPGPSARPLQASVPSSLGPGDLRGGPAASGCCVHAVTESCLAPLGRAPRALLGSALGGPGPGPCALPATSPLCFPLRPQLSRPQNGHDAAHSTDLRGLSKRIRETPGKAGALQPARPSVPLEPRLPKKPPPAPCQLVLRGTLSRGASPSVLGFASGHTHLNCSHFYVMVLRFLSKWYTLIVIIRTARKPTDRK